MDVSQSSDNLEDEILLYVYKKKRTKHKDELKTYLKEPVILLKTIFYYGER